MCSMMNEHVQQATKGSNWVIFEDSAESITLIGDDYETETQCRGICFANPSYCPDASMFGESYNTHGMLFEDDEDIIDTPAFVNSRKISREDSAFSESSNSSSVNFHSDRRRSSATHRKWSYDEGPIKADIGGVDREETVSNLDPQLQPFSFMGLSRRNQRLDSAFSEIEDAQLLTTTDALNDFGSFTASPKAHDVTQPLPLAFEDQITSTNQCSEGSIVMQDGLPQSKIVEIWKVDHTGKRAMALNDSDALISSVNSEGTSSFGKDNKQLNYSKVHYQAASQIAGTQKKSSGDNETADMNLSSYTYASAKTPFDGVPGFNDSGIGRKGSIRKSRRSPGPGKHENSTTETSWNPPETARDFFGNKSAAITVQDLGDGRGNLENSVKYDRSWICFDDNNFDPAEPFKQQTFIPDTTHRQFIQEEADSKAPNTIRTRAEQESMAIDATSQMPGKISARNGPPLLSIRKIPIDSIRSTLSDADQQRSSGASHLLFNPGADPPEHEFICLDQKKVRRTVSSYGNHELCSTHFLCPKSKTESLHSDLASLTGKPDSTITSTGNSIEGYPHRDSFDGLHNLEQFLTPEDELQNQRMSDMVPSGKKENHAPKEPQDMSEGTQLKRVFQYGGAMSWPPDHLNGGEACDKPLGNWGIEGPYAFTANQKLLTSSCTHGEALDATDPILDDYPQEPADGHWSLWYKDCKRVKLFMRAEWLPVNVTLDTGTIRVCGVHSHDVVFKEIPLLPFFAFSAPLLKDVEKQNKLHVVKLQYVKYKEKKRYGTKIVTQHTPIFTSILKLASKDCSYIQRFMDLVESKIRSIPIHRDKGIAYDFEEIFINADDICHFLLSGEGKVMKYNVTVQIQMRAFLSGAPRLRLFLNDESSKNEEDATDGCNWIRFHKVEMHPCVDSELSNNEGCFNFIPPDGCKFEIVRFRVQYCKELPVMVKASLDLASSHSIKIKAEVKACKPENSTSFICNGVTMRFPIPNEWMSIFRKSRDIHGRRQYMSASANPLSLSAGSCRGKHCAMKVSLGAVSVEPEFGAIIWRIGNLPFVHQSLPEDATHTFSCHMELPFEIQLPDDFSPFAELDFVSPQPLGSNVLIRDLTVSSGISPEMWFYYRSRFSYKVMLQVLSYGKVIEKGSSYSSF